jgi:hypothetical protein
MEIVCACGSREFFHSLSKTWLGEIMTCRHCGNEHVLPLPWQERVWAAFTILGGMLFFLFGALSPYGVSKWLLE